MSEITQARLKEILKYDPKTGEFTWLVRTANRVKIGDIAGSLDKNGYLQIKIDYKLYRAHRLAFLYMTGKFPEKGLQVDHINHVREDNRWINLRIVTRQDNLKNSSLSKNNKVGCTGVYWHKTNNKWLARIHVNGKNKHLGYFDNLDDAIACRKAAELKYGFHKNHGKKELKNNI